MSQSTSTPPHRHHSRRYSLVEDYFSRPSPNMAYLVGFLLADGYVNEVGGCVQIGLASRDRAHLEKINAVLGSDAPIRDWSHVSFGVLCHTSAIRFNSRRMVTDLVKLGVRQAKSFTAVPWDAPADLVPDLMRGLVDGDGCISGRWEDGHWAGRSWTVNLVGSRPCVQAFARFAESLHGVHKEPAAKKKIWHVGYYALDQVQAMLRVLYYPGVITYLDRKKALADQALACERMDQDWSWLTRDFLEAGYDKHGTWEGVMADLGIDASTLRQHRQRLGMGFAVHAHDDLTQEQLLSAYEDLGSWRLVAECLRLTNMTRLRSRLAARDDVAFVSHKHRSWSHLTAGELNRLRDVHGSWQAVAKVVGTSARQIYHLITRLGLTGRGQPRLGRWMHVSADDLNRLRQEFGTWARVAEHLGMCPPNLHQLRHRLGML